MPDSADIILTTLPYPIVGIGRNFQILRLNQSAAAFLGNDPELSGNWESIKREKLCYETLYGRSSICPYCPVLAEWRSDASYRAERTVHVTRGKEKVLHLTMYNIQGGDPAMVEMIIDITEKKRLEEDNLRKENLASLGTMISGIAHELNNPLTGMNLTLQTLEASLPALSPESIAARLGMLRKDLSRASLMVADILGFSATGEVKRLRTNLGQVIQKAILNVKRLYPVLSRQVDFRLQIQADLFLFLNPQKIERLFINIFKNSIQALDYRPGYISVEARTSRHWAQIIIEDDAGGIPDEYIQRIFDPFFTRGQGGKGLGLSIAYNTINEHKGKIRASSSDGKTRFSILLPLET
ncbi:MAG: histidine kinase [Spirochaetales bacterium]|nr:histidine kinase [Spirochaetales bacterium]